MQSLSSSVDLVIAQASGGDTDALGQVFDVVRDRLKRMVQMRLDHRLYGRLDPSDVVQEAFLDASRRLPEFAAERKMPLLLWVRLLTGQRLIDLHRHHLGAQGRDARLEVSIQQFDVPRTSTIWLAEQLVAKAESANTTLVRDELRHRVRAVLDGMAPLDREILAMRHFEALSNQEVAEFLRISKTAASNRYIRALERLKHAWHAKSELPAGGANHA